MIYYQWAADDILKNSSGMLLLVLYNKCYGFQEGIFSINNDLSFQKIIKFLPNNEEIIKFYHRCHLGRYWPDDGDTFDDDLPTTYLEYPFH